MMVVAIAQPGLFGSLVSDVWIALVATGAIVSFQAELSSFWLDMAGSAVLSTVLVVQLKLV